MKAYVKMKLKFFCYNTEPLGVHPVLFSRSGYERYNAMRADPDLCFLERVGMPDVTALSAEQGGVEGSSDVTER